MDNQAHKNQHPGQGNPERAERNSSTSYDLPDSDQDRKKLEPQETFIDLPDVKDIPGQEFVHAPPLGMLADTTVSSADEEGEGLFEDDEEELIRSGESSVSREERETLERVSMPSRDEQNLERASMDNRDFDGTPLNEASFGRERSGSDLDVPGSELDDRNERIGEEDEENNDYSLGGSDNDNLNEGRS